MKEEKIDITLNQEDVQNMIDCYEKDIEYIKKLEEKIDEAIDYIENNSGMISKWTGIKSKYAQEELSTDQLDNLLEILKGEKE